MPSFSAPLRTPRLMLAGNSFHGFLNFSIAAALSAPMIAFHRTLSVSVKTFGVQIAAQPNFGLLWASIALASKRLGKERRDTGGPDLASSPLAMFCPWCCDV